MKIKLNSKTLNKIKGLSEVNDLKDYKGLSNKEVEQMLLILAFIRYTNSLGLLRDIEVEIG